MHAVLPEAEEINMANGLPAVVMMGGLLLLRPYVKAVSAFGTADAFLAAAPVQPQQSFAMGAFEIFILSHPADAIAELPDPVSCVLIPGCEFFVFKRAFGLVLF